jgi:hypothetical protein
MLAGTLALAPATFAQPWTVEDIADIDPEAGGLLRVLGSVGSGSTGLPVAGGHDMDGDGFEDVAVGSMVASPLLRFAAGQVFLVFGNGDVRGSVDTALPREDVLIIYGDGPQENAGSEIWMDDVTGDGFGDLLIARQNFTPDASRVGAGALTILLGSPALRTLARSSTPIDLRAPPPGLTLVTLIGPSAFARLGIWMRTGDVTGDRIPDFVVGADQESTPSERHRGAAYLVRGGSELAGVGLVDLANFGSTPLAGHVAKLSPPPLAAEYHLGATCQIADLDGNQRAEVLLAATLNRAGATLRAFGAPIGAAHGSGGAPLGHLYIAWDDNFAGNPWPPGYAFDFSSTPGSRTVIRGGIGNRSFGEEILGGLDYDGNWMADLFVGDIVGDVSPMSNRPNAGSGHVLFDAARLRGLDFRIDLPPPNLRVTTLLGGATGDIASDTAAHGDFDGDGVADITVASPHGTRLGRIGAGVVHLIFGQRAPWPAVIDLAPGALPPPEALRITEIIGAKGRVGADAGDTLSYSAAAGDLDGDGRVDFVTNEMLGNGATPAAEDTGNLIVLSGRLLAGNVDIDITPFKPGNHIDPLGDALVSVAILGSERFDVRDLEVETLGFGPDATAPVFDLSHRLVFFLSHRDINGDRHRDLIAAFDPRETGLAFGDSRACVRGTRGRVAFHACDSVTVISRGCGLGFELALVLPFFARFRRRVGATSSSTSRRRRGATGPGECDR